MAVRLVALARQRRSSVVVAAQTLPARNADVPGDGIVVGWALPGEGGIPNNYTLAIDAVPEPGTGVLAALGAAALLGLSRRKQD